MKIKCQECFKIFETKNKKRKFCSNSTRKKQSLTRGGTGIPYENAEYPEEFIKIRQEIRKRDNFTCQLCFNYGKYVHHIDYNRKNNDENNLLCLCPHCNIKVNFNRKYWQKYFKDLIKLRNESIISRT